MKQVLHPLNLATFSVLQFQSQVKAISFLGVGVGESWVEEGEMGLEGEVEGAMAWKH
jgi:hypothetical protein